ncbi:MAG: signal peptidase II [Lachnospiraceae bacterium]|nr:signal peptidase II [Lachnospiraceae bacterium]
MNNNESRSRHYLFAIFGIIAGVLFDQWTKYMALAHLRGQEPYVLIKNVFELDYLENRGAAFGMLQNKQILFILCVALISIFVVVFYKNVSLSRHFLPLRVCAILIMAGAIGNVIDRIFRHYVVDFFYFSLINFPVFNVADIYVTVAAILLILLLLFYYKEEDLEQIFHNQKRK